MTCKIVAGRLHKDGEPVPFVRATSQGGRILPTLIVLHDTAGRLDKGSSVSWFASKACKTSAHFVVEIDGSVTQMVAGDHKAFHAGQSTFKGRSFCNGYSIGIEIVNPGKCDAAGRAWFHKQSETGFDDLEKAETKAHGMGWWMPYTPAQVATVTAMCKAISAAYPVSNITTHYEISPGRKVDVNPLFPVDDVRRAVFGLKKRPGTPPEAISTLAVGSEGPGVKAAQDRLKQLGYTVGIADGHFGPLMRAAVLAFEAENGLATDGQLDAGDRERLESAEAKAMPSGARSEATVSDLKETSRSVANLVTLKNAALVTGGVSGAVGVGNEAVGPVADPVSIENLGKAAEGAGYVQTIGEAVGIFAHALSQNGWLMGLVLAGVAYLVATKLLGFRVEEFRSGRYHPSGGK